MTLVALLNELSEQIATLPMAVRGDIIRELRLADKAGSDLRSALQFLQRDPDNERLQAQVKTNLLEVITTVSRALTLAGDDDAPDFQALALQVRRIFR